MSYKSIATRDEEKESSDACCQTDPAPDSYKYDYNEGLSEDPEKMSEQTKSIWKKVEEIREKRIEKEKKRIETSLEQLKSRTGWKTIRIFVSSTFKDFHSEREALVKKVMTISYSRFSRFQ